MIINAPAKTDGERRIDFRIGDNKTWRYFGGLGLNSVWYQARVQRTNAEQIEINPYITIAERRLAQVLNLGDKNDAYLGLFTRFPDLDVIDYSGMSGPHRSSHQRKEEQQHCYSANKGPHISKNVFNFQFPLQILSGSVCCLSMLKPERTLTAASYKALYSFCDPMLEREVISNCRKSLYFLLTGRHDKAKFERPVIT